VSGRNEVRAAEAACNRRNEIIGVMRLKVLLIEPL
jgi:hypothetical protein